MENRTMTTEELAGYTGSFYGFVLDSDEYASRLYVATRTVPGSDADDDGAFPYEYLLYGDLTAAFGIDEHFEETEHGDFGNHAVSRIVQEALADHPLGRHIEAVFDPEGMTFFAYTQDRISAVTLATFIADLVAERRKAVAS